MKIFRAGTWSKTHGRGFTFLEIIVVLLVIGLLLLLIYPKVHLLTEDGLQKASRGLVGVIQHLYQETVFTREVHRLTYDLQAGEYQVSIVAQGGKLEPPSGQMAQRVSLPRGVSFQDVVTLRHGKVTHGEAFTQFFPAGWVEHTVIHLSDADRRSSTLQINPVTGRVKVYEGYIEIEKRTE